MSEYSRYFFFFKKKRTDICPSLSLTYEKADPDIMLRKPRKASRDHLVNAKLLLQAYGFIGMTEMLFAHWMFFMYLSIYGGITFKDTIFGKLKIPYLNIGFFITCSKFFIITIL